MSRVKIERVKLWAGFLLLPALLAGCAAAQTSGAATAKPSLAFARAERLKRGVNLSEWFAQVYDKRGYTPEHFQAWTTAEDIALIKSMGFDHVRLGVNPQPKFDQGEPDKTPLFNEGEPNSIPPAYLGYLDAAVKMILDHGLAVVIDLHPDPGGAFKARMAKEDDFVEKVADFWQALAAHYSDPKKWDPDRVFFEIMNEPEFTDRYRWLGVQMKLAPAIRRGAPLITIIAAGARWSNDDELVFQEPIRDANVIYNFHFYEPHVFTHQGANWSTYYYHWLRDKKHPVSYPSNLESATAAAAQVPDAVDRLQVIRYGSEHWDSARIEAEMKQAKEWASTRGVPLICNEFGVYGEYADPGDRAAWLRDVRTALERNGIGWTLWDYSGQFGVVTKKDGKAVADEGVLRALGMK